MWSFVGLLVAILIVAATSARSEDSSEWIAKVNGTKIGAQAIDKALGVRLSELEGELFKLRHAELDRQIDERLLQQEASQQNLSIDELIRLNVTAKAALVTESELDAAYETSKSRFVGNEAMIRDRLRIMLQEQKLAEHKKMYMASLRSRADITDRLLPPPVTRFAISEDGFPTQGPIDAPVSIVEFSDFHCPYCKRVQETLKVIRSQYGQNVRLVYRQFPIRGLHPEAFRAAEAALCAGDQGKFWEYHDALFEQAPKANDDDLKRYARQVGLNEGQFMKCLFQSKYHEVVQRDLEEATKLGLTGTPAFFINGRFLNGAQPLEKFVQIIDEELARAQSGTVSMRKQ